MNLIIDQGNTQAKLAIFQNNQLVKWGNTPLAIGEFITNFIGEASITGIILSSVRELPKDTISSLKSISSNLIVLNHQTRLPFTLAYRTPETLGRDRIAAVAGAWFDHPGCNILVIDAGTAITYDFIEASGIYQGGNIAPGLEMRLKALHHFTGKLPLVSKTGDTPLLGYNTETAIRSGVVQGLIFEIESYIDRLKTEKRNLLVFLTGGDAFYFDKKLKNTIFADEFLVLKGLNSILEYNAQN